MMMPLAFTSCEKSFNNSAGQPIDIQTGIEVMTRAPQLDNTGKGSFTEGDIFTLTMATDTEHLQQTYTVGHTSLYWEDFAFKAEKVTFAGCYPNLETGGSLTYDFNIQESPDKDLLLAPAVEVPVYSKTVVMPFRHAMHKLVVKYISDGSYTQEELNEISTTLYAYTACTVDLGKGVIAKNSAKSPDNYATQHGKDIFWFVVPQSRDGVKLTLSLNDRTCEVTLPVQTSENQSITALEGGKVLTITLLVSSNGISFSNIAIYGWEEQGVVEGEIII